MKKTIIIFWVLLLVCFLTSCRQCSKNKSNSISGIDAESFGSFISRFREDSIFQKSRLYISDSYAIVDKNELDSNKCNDKNLLWSEYDETCYDIVLIDRDNWKFLKSELLQERNEEYWFSLSIIRESSDVVSIKNTAIGASLFRRTQCMTFD